MIRTSDLLLRMGLLSSFSRTPAPHLSGGSAFLLMWGVELSFPLLPKCLSKAANNFPQTHFPRNRRISWSKAQLAPELRSGKLAPLLALPNGHGPSVGHLPNYVIRSFPRKVFLKFGTAQWS